MGDPWDEFFIRKIVQGLEARGLALTPEEEQLLRTSAFDMPDDFAARGKALLPKAIGALAEAYARDTAGKNRAEVARWRENITAMHNHSQLFVSAVMQEWYLSSGRAQEKRSSGCLPVLLMLSSIVCLLSVLLVWAVL